LDSVDGFDVFFDSSGLWHQRMTRIVVSTMM
jgi:hypothetical protein